MMLTDLKAVFVPFFVFGLNITLAFFIFLQYLTVTEPQVIIAMLSTNLYNLYIYIYI